jgi:hypothetical protein
MSEPAFKLNAAGGDLEHLGAPMTLFTTDHAGVWMWPGYFIDWVLLDSYPKLCGRIRHLAEKDWVTPDHLADLITAAEAHFGWPPASAGEPLRSPT